MEVEQIGKKNEKPNRSRNGFCFKVTVKASRKEETDDCVTHVIGDDTQKKTQTRYITEKWDQRKKQHQRLHQRLNLHHEAATKV